MNILKNILTIVLVGISNLIIFFSVIYAMASVDGARYDTQNNMAVTVLGVEAVLMGEDYECLYPEGGTHYMLRIKLENHELESISPEDLNLNIESTDDEYRYFAQEYDSGNVYTKQKQIVPAGKTGVVTRVIESFEDCKEIVVSLRSGAGDEPSFIVTLP